MEPKREALLAITKDKFAAKCYPKDLTHDAREKSRMRDLIKLSFAALPRSKAGGDPAIGFASIVTTFEIRDSDHFIDF